MKLLPGALGGAVLVVVLAACGTPAVAPGAPAAGTAPVSAPQTQPYSVTIPKIGAYSTLIPTGEDANGVPQVPDTAKQASWFEPGPEPGEVGRATIYGHVNYNHVPGVFERLHELAKGDQVQVAMVDGSTAVFTVTGEDTYDKTAFPAAQVYQPVNVPELVLVTCDGPLERTAHGAHYRDNLVVYATLDHVVSR